LHPDAEHWNARYSQERDYFLQRQPYELVRTHADLLRVGGVVLDAAAGVSPLGLFLSGRGLKVVALDISLPALCIARARFKAQGHQFSGAVVDLANSWLPVDYFDAVMNFYFLSRPLLALYRTAIRPGGLLFCEMLLWDGNLGARRDHYLLSGELEHIFADWRIIFSAEKWKHGRKSFAGPRKTVQLIAQRPNERESNK